MAAGGPQHSSVRPVEPVCLIERFPGLHQELMRLLRGLDEADWSRPTACALWSVKDIVAHLPDTGLRRLSSGRDGFIPAPEGGIASYTDRSPSSGGSSPRVSLRKRPVFGALAVMA